MDCRYRQQLGSVKIMAGRLMGCYDFLSPWGRQRRRGPSCPSSMRRKEQTRQGSLTILPRRCGLPNLCSKLGCLLRVSRQDRQIIDLTRLLPKCHWGVSKTSSAFPSCEASTSTLSGIILPSLRYWSTVLQRLLSSRMSMTRTSRTSLHLPPQLW